MYIVFEEFLFRVNKTGKRDNITLTGKKYITKIVLGQVKQIFFYNFKQ